MKSAKEIIEHMKQVYDMVLVKSCQPCSTILSNIKELDGMCEGCKITLSHRVMFFGFYKDLEIPTDKGLPTQIVRFADGYCFGLERYEQEKDKMISTLEKLLEDPENLKGLDKILCEKCGSLISTSAWIIEKLMHVGCPGTGRIKL